MLSSVRLAQLSHHLERCLDRALMEHDLSFRRYAALSVINDAPWMSRSEIARALRISPQAVGTVVRRLLMAGLVTRKATEPGQPLQISITPAGQAALRSAEPVARAAERQALDSLHAERDMLAEALRHTLRQLGSNGSSNGQEPHAEPRADTCRVRS